MKRNPFTKRTHGIGPGPGDMTQARIRAMATVARQADLIRTMNERERVKLERVQEAALSARNPLDS